MKNNKTITRVTLLIFLIFQINAIAQTELELLKSRATFYSKEGDLDFNRAFKFYEEKRYDSCYLYSSVYLRRIETGTKRNNDKIEILNYILGISAIHRNMLDKAFYNFSKIKDSGNYRNLRRINLGYIDTEKSRFSEAVFQYSQWLKESNRSDTKNMKSVFHNMGICYLHLKMYQKAQNFFNKEMDLSKINDTAQIIHSKISIANLYYEQYMDDKAIKLFKEAYSDAKLFSNSKLKRITTKNMAVVERNRERYKESVKYYQEFIKLNDSIWNRDKIWELTEKDKQLALAEKNKEILLKEEELKRENLEKILVMLVSSFLVVIILVYFWVRRRKIRYENKLETFKKTNKERNRISKELHDGILGKLFGVRFGLGFLDLKTDEDERAKYESFLNELEYIEKEIRDVSHKLNRPIELETNFINELEKMIKKKSLIGKFEYSFTYSDTEQFNLVNNEIKFTVFRVLEEAFQNIIKHSNASKVDLTINLVHKTLHLKLKDDGFGFDIEILREEGIGIGNMKSRVEEIQGEFFISSKVNSGTTLSLKIPEIKEIA